MALSTIENKVFNRIAFGSLLAGTGALGVALATDHGSSLVAVSTGSYALGAAALMVSHLYYQVGQKIAVWQTLRTSSDAVSIAKAADVEKIAERLQRLEHAIDHRLDVINNSAARNGKIAMGAWVHAAEHVLTKAQLFDVAASPVDRDPAKLTSNWPTVALQIENRMRSYTRMLTVGIVQPVPDTICNFQYPTF